MVRYPIIPDAVLHGADVADMVPSMIVGTSSSASTPTADVFRRPRATILIALPDVSEVDATKMAYLKSVVSDGARTVIGSDSLTQTLTMRNGVLLSQQLKNANAESLLMCASSSTDHCLTFGGCPNRVEAVDTGFSSKSMLAFAKEMGLLRAVPVVANPKKVGDAAPDMFVLAPVGLKAVFMEHGADSAEAAAALDHLDSVLREVAGFVEDQYPGRVVTHTLLAATGASSVASANAGSRTLLQATANSSTNVTITIAEIADYQISLWSAVILILVTLFTAQAMFAVNFDSDNLLNSRFKTNLDH
jgi:hypothetical protein